MRINTLLKPVSKPERKPRTCDTFAVKQPKLSREWHPDKNTCGPEDISWDCHQRAWWKCGKCGYEYEAEIDSRMAGVGCPVCAGKLIIPGVNSLADTNPALAAEYHPTKNCRPATKVSEKQAIVVWWKCSRCGHEWRAAITGRAQGRDCPNCCR